MLPNIKPLITPTVLLTALISLSFIPSISQISPLSPSYAFSQSDAPQKDLISLTESANNDLSSTVNLPTIFSMIVDDHYAKKAYLLYQIYNGDKYGKSLKPDQLQAQKYLQLAAELGHQDALIEMIDQSTNLYNAPGMYLDSQAKKYINMLLEKYPNSPKTLITVGNLYADYRKHFYNPEKSFELIQKASEISPSAEINYDLAKKY
ncbi:sel1 repeat family protein, partial [Providencia thailandensis]|nr:sel1 repeat family protein [Providencia thailandensis]